MIIDTTNDELLINGQRWQRGGYLQATAYGTEQINITARDGRVIGKALQWDAIYDEDKNLFGLNRDGVVTALTAVFDSRVKSPYNLEALRDVQDGTASYGDTLIWSAPGEWQYDTLTQYHHAYNSEAATLRAGATATTELYYTAQADGDGLSESAESNTPAEGYQIVRKLYYAEAAQADPDTGTWVQFADLAANTSFNDAKTALLAYLKERTGGTVPISLKMTWEEVEIYNGLLDSYGGAAAAYSVRRLSSAYTGPLIEVQRASDSTTQDIGYDANGDLDTTALATFCSGTTCTVRTWYDQSSNGNDAVQTTQANQPTIYTGGAVVLENGEPALDFDGVDDRMTPSSDINASPSNYEIFAVSNSVTDGTSYFFDARSGRLILDAQSIVITGSGDAYWDGVNNIANKFTADIQSVKTWLLDNTNNNSAAVYENALLHAGSLPYTQRAIAGITRIGNSSYDNRAWRGYLQELVFYATTASGNRSGIETNINDYFGIYTPFTTGLLDDYGGAAAAYSLRRLSSTYTGPLIRVRRASDNAEQDISADIEGNLNTGALAAFCSGTDGFVKTWYDQSGNGNDAEQTTTSEQPKIYDSSTGVVTENGKPAITRTSQTQELSFNIDRSSGVYSIAFVGQVVDRSVIISDNSTGYVLFAKNGESNSSFGNLSSVSLYVDGNASSIASAGDAYTAFNSNQSLIALFANHSWSSNSLTIGYAGSATGMYQAQELIIYTDDQSANRSGIETNINDYYSIYP